MSNWGDCLEDNSVIRRSKDEKMANSLKEIAFERVKWIERLKADENNSNFIFEAYYSSINELIHAISALKGYKILNHLCLGFFLRDLLEREDLYRLFDDLRFKRNGLLYYGKEMDFETAKEAINKSKNLFKYLQAFL